MTPQNAPPIASFNDDDVYVYNAETKQIVRTISCKDSQVRDSKYIGLRVNAGESWAKGMAAKSLGLWTGKKVAEFSTPQEVRNFALGIAATNPLETVNG